jgi:hypothetical protein
MNNVLRSWFLAPLSGFSEVVGQSFYLLRRLIGIDLLFIGAFSGAFVLHLVGLTAAVSPLFNFDIDLSLPGFFGFAKWAFCIACLMVAALNQKDWALFACGLIFVGILYDDANMVHERAGLILAGKLGLLSSLGLKAEDVGQLLAFATMAVLAAMLAGLGFAAGKPFGRSILLRFLVLFGGLIPVGVGVDAVHGIAANQLTDPAFEPLKLLLIIIEDGGELILGSACAAFSLGTARVPVETSARPN